VADVAVLGLGNMGSALARTLVASSADVVVWNRSPARAEPVATAGASVAETPGAAVAAAEVVLVCLDTYATTTSVLADAGVAGRTIVELGTGTPAQARSAARSFTARGAMYLDGAILGGPVGVGTPDLVIAYAGPRPVYDRVEPLLTPLAGGTRHVGEAPGAAAVLDLAWLTARLGIYVGIAHGAALCDADGVDLDAYAAVIADPGGRALVGVMRDGTFANPGATIAVWLEAVERIREHGAAAAVPGDVPDLVASLLRRAIAAGLGDEHVAALVKVLGGGGGPSNGTRAGPRRPGS
jgi:3-hydroxyisobutyrate dehydrogenase-like beta-hydroxyacid dehydrogenase